MRSTYRRKWHDRISVNMIAVAMVALFIGVFVGIGALHAYGTQNEHTVTVTGKERVCDGGDNGGCKYLIFTENNSTFRNEDTIYYWKFNSSDVHGMIRENQQYVLHTYGWRVGWLSMYPNVYHLEKIEN